MPRGTKRNHEGDVALQVGVKKKVKQKTESGRSRSDIRARVAMTEN